MSREAVQRGDEAIATRERVERTVRGAVERHALWRRGAPLVVAVSGGADSLCLLGTLLALREQESSVAPGEIVVAHLDHRLRGAEGEQDAAWVAAFARELGLRCEPGTADVPALARAERRSLEDAARHARYAFLRRVAAEVGAERICTGHTRDDQAETLVMHWLRGSGLDGLSGMPPLAGDIARPLLDLTRGDTVAYCAARGWAPRTDATNADTTYLRNRIRHELLPALEQYNPNLRQTLVRNAALIAEDERYLEAQTDRAWEDVLSDTSPSTNAIALDLVELCVLPGALRQRVLRRAARRLTARDTAQALEARHLLLLDDLIAQRRTGATLDLPAGLRVTRGYTALTFTLSSNPSAIAHATDSDASGDITPQPLALPVPGEVELPDAGWRIRAWHSVGPPGSEVSAQPDPPELPAFAFGGTYGSVGHAETRAYLDADVAGDTLLVRTWRRGDHFRPLGMRHEKKVQDYFTDAKVPRELRGQLPLVFNKDHLLWIAGLRIDDRVRLTERTRRILVLQLDRGTHASF
ncbi:MAG: tRNA lysidine(34) synthetase TilS [Ktedonobacterales bacterium]